MRDEVLQKLKEIPLFSEIKTNEEYLAEVRRISRTQKVSASQTIIAEGEKGEEMYIMLSGRVVIRRKTRAGDDYTVVALRAEDNVFFGEMALIDDDVRSATIVTTDASEFLILSKSDFWKLGERHPRIALSVTRVIAKILAGRLRKTTGDMLTIFDALVNELQQ